jgi:prevent-host-death family protein
MTGQFNWDKTMESVTALEAKTRFGQLLKRVAQGEEVIITRHEKPVARLVPEGRRNLESVREAVAGLFELRRQILHRNRGKPKLTAAEVKAWIGEGRR